ncbi:MAG: MFS transporter [Verrucomicrobia bacterium]|nr:MFS transporter [Verrucomicrobiota bacterium]MDA1203792.1 MFS transporter [Verrucomicrobiota bacterium]
MNNQQKLTNPFYVLLSLPSTAMGFALCVQISALSWILSTKYNLSIEHVGLVWLAGPLAGLLAQPIVGLISDKVWFWGGRRRPFILIGGVTASLMLLALPFLGELSEFSGIQILWTAIIIALTLDLAINVGFNPTRSIIADLTPEGEARTKGFTWMQTISGMFGVLAYVIGAVFGNYALIYFGVGLVLFFNVIPAFFLQEPRDLGPVATHDAPTEPTDGHGKTNLPRLLHIYVAHAFTWLGVQTMFVFMFAYAQHALFPGVSELDEGQKTSLGQIIAVSFLVMNVVGFILPVAVLQPMAKKVGLVRTHTICIFIMAVGYAGIIFFGTTATTLYALMAVVGIGWASVVSLPFAIMSDSVDKSRMGTFMGIFNLSIVIPQIVVSLAIGAVIGAAADKTITFIICASSLAISAVLWTFLKEDRTEPGELAMGGGGH